MKEIIDYIATYLYIYYIKLKKYYKKIKKYVIKNQKIIVFIVILLLIILLIYFYFGNDTYNMSGGADSTNYIVEKNYIGSGEIPFQRLRQEQNKFNKSSERNERKIQNYQYILNRNKEKNKKALKMTEDKARRAKKKRTNSTVFKQSQAFQNMFKDVSKGTLKNFSKYILLPFGALIGPPVASTIYGAKPFLENISVV